MRANILLFLILLVQLGISQDSPILSGPMVGPVVLRDATLWVQTSMSDEVYFLYKVKGEAEDFKKTMHKRAEANHANTITIHATDLEPNKTYEYKVVVNGNTIIPTHLQEFTTQPHWQFRSDAPDFDFIAGSCFYINDTSFDRPGKPYGGEYKIVDEMSKVNPDFMVWLGDNTYYREGDFECESGMYHRQGHTRALPELQPFIAKVPQYAIWDDHDYGNNDGDWTFPLKNQSLQIFKDFFPSETYGTGHTEGVTSTFGWNDCQFFMLDDRWYRTVNRENGTILGDQQKYWLKEALLASKATFKFISVGGQFLSDFAGFENFANYVDERKEIIDFLDDNNIKGVIFLTGDRHHSEISLLKTPKGNVFYDVTSSAITSQTYDHSSENNTLRVPGSMISEKNFAVFSVTGESKLRKVKVVFKNAEGRDLYEYEF